MKLTTELKNVLASKLVDGYNKKLDTECKTILARKDVKVLMREADVLNRREKKLNILKHEVYKQVQDVENKIHKIISYTNRINYSAPNSNREKGIITIRPVNIDDIIGKYRYNYNTKLKKIFDELLVTLQVEEFGKDVLSKLQKLIDTSLKKL